MPQEPIPEISHPERTADGLFRGILFQSLVTANVWLDLKPGETLVCEGNEDIVCVMTSPDGSIAEISEIQTKDLSQRISAKTEAVHETIFNFICSYDEHHRAGRSCRFVFMTTADMAKQQTGKGSRLGVDLLKSWHARSAQASVGDDSSLIEAIHKLVEHYAPKIDREVCPVRRALVSIDAQPERWREFLSATVWHAGAPGINEQLEMLKSKIFREPRFRTIAADQFAYRILLEVLYMSARPRPQDRNLTIEALHALAESEGAKLQEWVQRVHLERLQHFFALESRVWQLENDVSARAGELNPTLLRRFSEWTEKDCATFFAVGSTRPVKITDAWPVFAQWEGEDAKFLTQNILEIDSTRRAYALVGSAGAGKSTLLRMIAYSARDRGCTILRVPLRRILQSLEAGNDLPTAIAGYISTSLGVGVVEGRALFSRADLLELDGLDECGELLPLIVQGLEPLLAGRPLLRILLATRPDPAGALPTAFRRAELLPLPDEELEGFVGSLSLFDTTETLDRGTHTDLVRKAIEAVGLEPHPLYVAALAQVVETTSTVPRTRAAIFDRLLDALQTRSMNDRPGVRVASLVRSRVLAAAGLLQTELASVTLQSIARYVAVTRPPRAAISDADAETAVNFWHERGVLLRTSIIGNDTVEFIHESIAAFAGAKELVELDDSARLGYIKRLARRPDVVAFAAELGGSPIVDQVFACTSADDPDDFLLRAKCASTAETPDRDWLEALSMAAETLVASNIPLIAAESALAVAPLAVHAPQNFQRVIDRANAANGAWNHLAAFLISIAMPDTVDASELKRAVVCCSKDAPLREGSARDEWTERRLWNAIVGTALDLLHTRIEKSEFSALTAELLKGASPIGFFVHQKILSRLLEWGIPEAVPNVILQFIGLAAILTSLSGGLEPFWQAEMSLLRALDAAVGPAMAFTGVRPAPTAGKGLAMVMAGCGLPDASMESVLSHGFESSGRLGAEILRSLVHALDLDRTALCAEIAEFRAAWPEPPKWDYPGILQEASRIPLKVAWIRGARSFPSVDDILDEIGSLDESVGNCALQILLIHPDVVRVKARIDRAVPFVGSAHVAILMNRGHQLYGGDERALLFDIVERNLNETTCSLVHRLAFLCPSDLRFVVIVRKALRADCAEVVRCAAQCVLRCSTRLDVTSDLRDTLKRWLAWKSGGVPLISLSAGTVLCGTSLRLPEVYHDLFLAFVSDCSVTSEELLQWVLEPSVSYMASRELAARATLSDAEALAFLNHVSSTTIGVDALTRFVSGSSKILLNTKVEEQLLALTLHDEVSVRKAVIEALGSVKWGSQESQTKAIEARLKDPEPGVRNAATQALKLRRSGTTSQ